MRFHSHKGFSIVEVVVVLAVIGIAVAGWFVWNAKDSDTENPQNQQGMNQGNPNQNGPGNQYNWSSSTQGPYMDNVAYATSTDLLNWTDSGKIIAEHSSVPDIINKDGVLYVYFVDVNTDGKAEQVGLKTSSDNGSNWSDTKIINISGLDGKIAVDPDPFLLPDGRIRLYYFDISSSRGPNSTTDHSIYSAISDDGINFTEEDGVRLTLPHILDPDVIKVGDTWRMYVGGPNQQILSAKSSDGLTFTYEGVASEGGVPNIVYENNQYILFTAGIHLATSQDGKTFTRANSQFQSTSGSAADPGVVKLGPNNYLMVYKTNTSAANSNPAQPSQP